WFSPRSLRSSASLRWQLLLFAVAGSSLAPPAIMSPHVVPSASNPRLPAFGQWLARLQRRVGDRGARSSPAAAGGLHQPGTRRSAPRAGAAILRTGSARESVSRLGNAALR